MNSASQYKLLIAVCTTDKNNSFIKCKCSQSQY